MNIGKKIKDGLIGVRLRAALKGGPTQPKFSANDQFGGPASAEQPRRDGCPACTAPGFRVDCGSESFLCPRASWDPDADQRNDAAAGYQPRRTGPGQPPDSAFPWAAAILLWAAGLAKLALQAVTWWRQAK
jgi:hypothetical protein